MLEAGMRVPRRMTSENADFLLEQCTQRSPTSHSFVDFDTLTMNSIRDVAITASFDGSRIYQSRIWRCIQTNLAASSSDQE